MAYSRYAIYFMPDGAFAEFGAHWLGWDPHTRTETKGFTLEGLPRPREVLIKSPQKYGLHATMKAPFRLAEGETEAGLMSAFNGFCKTHKTACAGQLQFSNFGGFLSLRPSSPVQELKQLAAACVTAFDKFRSPATPQELARRRKANLTAAQDDLLQTWGYPYVMDEFRFHITLTGRVDLSEAEQITTVLKPMLNPLLTKPFAIADLVLAAEGQDGRFCIRERAKLLI